MVPKIRNKPCDCREWVKLVCEIIIAAAAVAALWYAGSQAHDLHRQTELQSRPFLSFVPSQFRIRFDEPGESEAEVWCDLDYKLKNVGPIPAYNVLIEKFDIVIDRGTIHASDLPSKSEVIAVFPGEPLRESRRFTLGKEIARDYYAGKKNFRVGAKISYRGVELLKANPYWFEVSAESTGAHQEFILIRTDGN